MIKLTDEQVEFFKNTFIYYQKKFQLEDYKMFFEIVEDKDFYAKITVDHSGALFMLTLNREYLPLGITGSIEEQLKSVAKHEAIHLLIGRMNACAISRFVTSDEINHFNETLVRKLEWLILD